MVGPGGGRELLVSSVSFSSLSPLLGVLARPSLSLKLSALLGVPGSPSPARLPLLLMGPSEPMRDRLLSRFTALMELRLRGTMGLCRSKHQPDLDYLVGIRWPEKHFVQAAHGLCTSRYTPPSAWRVSGCCPCRDTS